MSGCIAAMSLFRRIGSVSPIGGSVYVTNSNLLTHLNILDGDNINYAINVLLGSDLAVGNTGMIDP